MLSKASRLRTAAVAALAALSLGGVAAAASGLAPAAAGRSPQASPTTSGARAAAAHGQAATLVHGSDAAAGSSTGSQSDHATGPDASGAASHGLCQAWFAGQGDANGRRSDAPAFQAVAAAAGGADQVAAYCAADTGSAAKGQRPAAPANGQGRSTPPATGPPASPGNGHGQGGPPTTS